MKLGTLAGKLWMLEMMGGGGRGKLTAEHLLSLHSLKR